jgi:putative hydrolase of the HAD superfamily
MPRGAVTLDAVGTLFTVVEPVGVTYATTARRHRLTANPAEIEARFQSALAAAPPLAFAGASGRDLAARERAWWYAVVRQALDKQAPAAGLEACCAELFAHYARARAWRVFPEVTDVLAALRADGLKVAVVSNFDTRLPGLIADLDLASRLDAVVYSTGVGAAKPAAAIFHHAATRLGVAAAQVTHVGDSVAHDVEGALRAGFGAVLVDRAGGLKATPSDVPTIATLAALPPLLPA